MFDHEYNFRGSHAEKVKKMTSEISSATHAKVFSRNIDVYIMAPIVGLVYKRMAEPDKSSGVTTKIFVETLQGENSVLRYNYELVMLSIGKDTLPLETRMDNAFRYVQGPEYEKNMQKYDAYVLGGVEVMYERIFGNDLLLTEEKLAVNLMSFLEEYNEKYLKEMEDIDMESLIKLVSDR